MKRLRCLINSDESPLLAVTSSDAGYRPDPGRLPWEAPSSRRSSRQGSPAPSRRQSWHHQRAAVPPPDRALDHHPAQRDERAKLDPLPGSQTGHPQRTQLIAATRAPQNGQFRLTAVGIDQGVFDSGGGTQTSGDKLWISARRPARRADAAARLQRARQTSQKQRQRPGRRALRILRISALCRRPGLEQQLALCQTLYCWQFCW